METYAKDIHLSLGLREGVEYSLNTLLHLWDEMQSNSVEAGQTPDPNLFTFAECCFFFAVIMKPLGGDEDSLDGSEIKTEAPPSSYAPAPIFPSSPRTPQGTPDAEPFNFFDDDHHSKLTGVPLNRPALREPAIGFVYCTESPGQHGHTGEVNIGVIIHSHFRGRGYARQAVELVLKFVFETLHYHRVQAAVLDTLLKDRALSLFTQL
jgi:hypothetical protein